MLFKLTWPSPSSRFLPHAITFLQRLWPCRWWLVLSLVRPVYSPFLVNELLVCLLPLLLLLLLILLVMVDAIVFSLCSVVPFCCCVFLLLFPRALLYGLVAVVVHSSVSFSLYVYSPPSIYIFFLVSFSFFWCFFCLASLFFNFTL